MLSKLRSLFQTTPKINLPKPSDENLFAACRSILHNDKMGYKIAVGPSRMPNAGLGLLLTEGNIKKGDIVALYSGHYFPPPPTWSVAPPDGEPVIKAPQSMRTAEQMAPGEDPEAYTIHCNNVGGVIDGLLFAQEALRGYATGKVDPYVSAQLINHPPAGVLPNVFSFSFAWPQYVQYAQQRHRQHSQGGASMSDSAGVTEDQFINKVNPIAQGIWFYDPWTSDAVMLYPDCAPAAGLAAIALRDISPGEELYMDYKYHKNNRPDWYTPVDYGLAASRE